MGKDKGNKMKLILAVLFALLMLIGNFYAVKGIKNCGLEAYFYQRMLVAYEVGAMPGLKQELSRVLTQDKFPRELVLAREFEKNLGSLKDPQQFLKGIVKKKIDKVNFFQHIRNLAIALILILLIARIWLIKLL